MTPPVRCCMASCSRAGEFHEPDGPGNGWWFCDPCFAIHLAIRREDYGRSLPPTQIRDRRREPTQPCGTHAAYARHKKAHEQPCSACVEAEREYQRARYARRKAS